MSSRSRHQDAMFAVSAERERQDKKWGPPLLPSGGHGTGTHRPFEFMHHAHGLPVLADPDAAKMLCERARSEGRLTFSHILIEEVAEALAEDDVTKLEVELVQVAAVCVKWLEVIAQRRDAQVGVAQLKDAAGGCLLSKPSCPKGGEHQWDGKEYILPDGLGSSATCSKCGVDATSHSMMYAP